MNASPVYVLGGSQTDFARNWAREGLDIFAMFREALDDALRETSIEPAQIEVGHVGNFVGELFTGQGLLNGFFAEVHPDMSGMPSSRHEAACASGSMALLAALRDIEAGYYGVACVLGIEYMRNVPGQTGADYLGAATWKGREATDCQFPWPHLFDRIIDEYEARHGLDTRHLKAIAELNFANARRNPRAQTRNWRFPAGCFSDDDALNPPVEGRVRKLDCGQITDGAACLLIAAADFARDWAADRGLSLADLPRIKGWGHRSAPTSLASKLAASRNQALLFPHVAQTFADALRRAGMGSVQDLDGLETHDCFTISEYLAIDHAGLTAPGRSWEAIEDGRIAPDGAFPINPSGGLIGLGHPVGATGVRMVLDCARQLSGTAGTYQLPRARNMATFNLGGSMTTCASFVIGLD